MIKYITKPIIVIIGLVLSLGSKANSYPDDFIEFFIEGKNEVLIIIAGEENGININALTTYDRIRVKSELDLAELILFLKGEAVSSKAISQIMQDLLNGVKSDSQCTGSLESCVVIPDQSEIRYVYDFDRNVLRLFIAPDLVGSSAYEISYHQSISDYNALINWTNLYAYSDLNDQNYLTWSNDTILGLPLGYLNLDSQYSSHGDALNIYSAKYFVDLDGHQLQVGRDRYTPSINTTDYLNVGSRLAGDIALIGSSSNLLENKTENYGSIEFYAPQYSLLQVYRGERIVLSRNISQGRQVINYDELPSGSYDIDIVLSVGEEVILRDSRQIVNRKNFSLGVGSLDYSLMVGKFEDLKGNETGLNDQGFLRGLINYRVKEDTFLGGGITRTFDESAINIGGQFVPSDKFSFEANGTRFDNSDHYSNIRLSYGIFDVEYRDFETRENYNFELSKQLISQNSFTNYGLGVSGYVSDYSLYARYSNNTSSGNRKNNTQTITGGVGTSLGKGYLGVDFAYSNYNKSEQDDLRVNLTWSRALGNSDSLSTQVVSSFDRDGLSRYSHSIRHSYQDSNLSANNSSSLVYDSKNSDVASEVSSSVTINSDYINTSAYGYLSDNGQKSFSGNISGSQILSSTGFNASGSRSSAFAKVKSDNVHMISSEYSSPYVNVTNNGKYRNRIEIDRDELLIPLDKYSVNSLTMDSSDNRLEGNSGYYNGFTHPGTLTTIGANFSVLESIILLLDDIDGNPIELVQCLGDGCGTIEPLSSDGVFRVNYKEGLDFQIVAREGLCIYQKSDNGEHFEGMCMPGINSLFSIDIEGVTFEQVVSSKSLLGASKSRHEIGEVIDVLKKQHIEYVVINFDEISYVYIESDFDLTAERLEYLSMIEERLSFTLQNISVDISRLK